MTSTNDLPIGTVISGHTFTVDVRYVLQDSRILGETKISCLSWQIATAKNLHCLNTLRERIIWGCLHCLWLDSKNRYGHQEDPTLCQRWVGCQAYPERDSADEASWRTSQREILNTLTDYPISDVTCYYYWQIISLYELSLFQPKTELYMMMELMDCDLHRVIQSKSARSRVLSSVSVVLPQLV